jgi:hypothetical protein
MFRSLSGVRHVAIAALSLGVAAGVQAQTRISINGLVADSVQVFSQDALDAYDLKSVTVTARGNASGSGNTFRLPITEVYLGNSKYSGIAGGIVKGGAVGSALEIACISDITGQRIGLTLANFRIDYHRKQVMADVTPLGGQTLANQAVYTYKVRRAMAIEADASGKLVLDERLVGLRLTPAMVAQMTRSLELDEISVAVIESIEFGELKQKIDIAFRAPVSDKPYIPQ